MPNLFAWLLLVWIHTGKKNRLQGNNYVLLLFFIGIKNKTKNLCYFCSNIQCSVLSRNLEAKVALIFPSYLYKKAPKSVSLFYFYKTIWFYFTHHNHTTSFTLIAINFNLSIPLTQKSLMSYFLQITYNPVAF